MKSLRYHKGLVIPLDYENIDTDVILPKQFLKRIEKTGYEDFLFYDWRYTDNGDENPDFILNHTKYKDATILLARKNFGSGSSREHAVWALENYGFKIILAPSFGEIYYNNCFLNGVLPIQLNNKHINQLFRRSEKIENYTLEVDVEKKLLFDHYNFYQEFDLDTYRQNMLLKGLDEIGMTLQNEADIRNFELSHQVFYQL